MFLTLECTEPKMGNANTRGGEAYDRSSDKAALEICALLAFYAAQNGSFLPTFCDKLSVPSSTGR